jgi:hypothetical protein
MKTESDPTTKRVGDTLITSYTSYTGRFHLNLGIKKVYGRDTLIKILNHWDYNTGGMRPTFQDYMKYR